jgi:RimJ/RimL family protein N-acetyltransferase
MNEYIKETYSKNFDKFLQNTLLVCNKDEKPIATCSHWKAYGKINTIQWFKTHKDYEGKGIGRALLSEIMKRFDNRDYPIYLHTQPGSFRAIKLYSEFGFCLLKGGQLGARTNDLEKCLVILERFMLKSVFKKLKVVETPLSIMKNLEKETTIQF